MENRDLQGQKDTMATMIFLFLLFFGALGIASMSGRLKRERVSKERNHARDMMKADMTKVANSPVPSPMHYCVPASKGIEIWLRAIELHPNSKEVGISLDQWTLLGSIAARWPLTV